VRLLLPEGQQVLCRNMETSLTADSAGAIAARFEAVLLPEDLILRRTMTLPKLESVDLLAALALEVQSLSPFGLDDTVWTHYIGQHDERACTVHLVLSARKLIVQYLASSYSGLNAQSTEVWVCAVGSDGYRVMPGFGGAARQRHGTLWRWVSAFLLVVLLALMAALAVTPAVQFYLRSLQANHAMLLLQNKIGPVVAQREAFLRTSEQLDSLAKLVGKPVPVLQALDLVTRALPDDTSLLSFKLNGLKVSVSGLTGNSATLMKQLGATPGLKDVRAPSAAIKPLGAARESFSIEFMLSPEQLGPAP
jgi:general secretion pathway protein L